MDLFRPNDTVLKDIVGRLVEAYEPISLYLFGSLARGDDGPDSDYDILIVVPDNAPPERLRSRLAYRALRGTAVATDVVVLTRTSFDRSLEFEASLPSTVLREGHLIHDAA